jgi:hypothetical protein
MALHLSGVVFRRKWKPPRLKLWEGPFADTQRLPQHPSVAAERAAARKRGGCGMRTACEKRRSGRRNATMPQTLTHKSGIPGLKAHALGPFRLSAPPPPTAHGSIHARDQQRADPSKRACCGSSAAFFARNKIRSPPGVLPFSFFDRFNHRPRRLRTLGGPAASLSPRARACALPHSTRSGRKRRGRRHRQARQDGVGYDGHGRVLQRTRRACGVNVIASGRSGHREDAESLSRLFALQRGAMLRLKVFF